MGKFEIGKGLNQECRNSHCALRADGERGLRQRAYPTRSRSEDRTEGVNRK